jgi:hypothetical protein
LQFRCVLLKDFKRWALAQTEKIKEAAIAVPGYEDRPNEYLQDPTIRKDEFAREIARRDGIESGPVCLIRAVEPCWSFGIHRDKSTKKLVLQKEYAKCLHLYHYEMHPQFGLMHVRLQTWLPFTMRVYINGRAWLSRMLDDEGIKYQRAENCFLAISDLARANILSREQIKLNWSKTLTELHQRYNPGLKLVDQELSYYWSIEQSEWATDVLFESAESLSGLYRRLLLHSMTSFGSNDVLRFLGHKLNAQGQPYAHFNGEVSTSLKRRYEGIRIKHRVKENSLKMYNKQGSVLRVETTINNPKEFRVFRKKTKGKVKDQQKPDWLTMRKGVADIARRAQVSSAANARYLEALASVSEAESVKHSIATAAQPVQFKQQRVRALNPFADDDARLLLAVASGAFKLNGFRNSDLQGLLYPAGPISTKVKQTRGAAVTRRLRILRAHGLINKIPRTYRYKLSQKGEQLVAILAHSDCIKCADFIKMAA